MKSSHLLFVCFTLSVFAVSAWAQLPGSTTMPYKKADESKTQFGAPLNMNQKAITVDEAIEQFKARTATAAQASHTTASATKKTETKAVQPILLEAKIDKVCLKKGCWMTIKSKTRDMRVIFKDYSFFVPTSIVGKTVYAEGFVKEEKLTLAETKHFVQDEGGDPSKVTEPITDYQFEAIGVVVKNP